jgi:hypothetical protein
MKLPIQSLALPQSILLIGFVCGVPAAAELPRDDENASHNVEFAEVEGHSCLQPVVRSADADLQDFRAAERRWLSDHFPGEPVPRWKNQLIMEPDVLHDGRYLDATVETETAYVHVADGWDIEVCFDVGVKTAKKAESK